jgi:hypothetical protein
MLADSLANCERIKIEPELLSREVEEGDCGGEVCVCVCVRALTEASFPTSVSLSHQKEFLDTSKTGRRMGPELAGCKKLTTSPTREPASTVPRDECFTKVSLNDHRGERLA